MLPSEGKNRPQLRGGTKRFIPCLYLCLAEVSEGPYSGSRCSHNSGNPLPIGFALNLKRRRALHSLRDHHRGDACAAKISTGRLDEEEKVRGIAAPQEKSSCNFLSLS